MIGIAEMFAELDGYDRYEAALEIWSRARHAERIEYLREYESNPINKARANARVRRWRTNNPERAQANARRARETWRRKHPEAFKAKERRRRQNYRKQHPDKVREWNRKHQAARRARLKAAAMCKEAA